MKEWSLGLFQCCSSHPKLSCCMCLLAPITGCWITYQNFKEIADVSVGRKRACLTCCCPLCFYPLNRQEIRQRKQIDGGCINDCCAHLCCHCCTMIQQFHECHESGYTRAP